MKQRRSPHHGFSLIELTLAMGMVAMLSLSLYLAMNIALRARRSALAAVEPARAVAIAGDIIRQDLESVLPPTGIFSGPFIGYHQLGSGGDSDTVQFYALGGDDVPAADAAAPAQSSALRTLGAAQVESPMSEGIRRIELALREDVTPPVLVRRLTRNLLPSIEQPPEEEIICRNVRSLSIRYFDGSTWLDYWDSTTFEDALPIAVAVVIETSDPQAPEQAAGSTQRTTRIIPLACAKPLS